MKRDADGVAGMSVDTATVGCPACREAASGHCAQHPAAGSREGSEPTVSSGQRRFYSEPSASNVELSQGEDFELHIAEGEPPARKHGPLADTEPPKPHVWAARASKPAARRGRPSKGWRRHLRRTKALGRVGRSPA